MKKAILVLFTILSLLGTCVALGFSLFWGFLTSIVMLFGLSKDKKEQMKWGLKGLKQVSSLYVIILLLGANISIWLASGMIPTLVYYGFSLLEKTNFLSVAFVVTALVSSVMGTGLGTLSTIGIAFYGMGLGFGLPGPVVLGTIVSGSFIADKISPVSALTNLTLKLVGVSYQSYVKSAWATLSVTLGITTLIYFVMNGFVTQTGTLQSDIYRGVIGGHYVVSPYLLLLPLVMLFLSLRGFGVIKNMLFVLFSGTFLAVFIQKTSLLVVLKAMIFGYQAETGHVLIDGIFKAGGIVPMIEVVCIVAAAVLLNSLLMHSKTLEPLFEKLLYRTRTRPALIFKTALLSVFLTTITCDQTVGIVVPAEKLQKRYEDLGIPKEILARTLSDTGTIIAPLQFWNVNALIITGLTGISAIHYGPYAVLCYIAPLVTLGFAKYSKK